MPPLRSPYPFLPPLRCPTCDDALPPHRYAGHCTYCRKLKSDLKTGRKHPTDWGTARARRLQLVIWHQLTGQLLTDPYAPNEPQGELTTAPTLTWPEPPAPPPWSNLDGSS
jgi:hypothetical protein